MDDDDDYDDDDDDDGDDDNDDDDDGNDDDDDDRCILLNLCHQKPSEKLHFEDDDYKRIVVTHYPQGHSNFDVLVMLFPYDTACN